MEFNISETRRDRESETTQGHVEPGPSGSGQSFRISGLVSGFLQPASAAPWWSFHQDKGKSENENTLVSFKLS